MTDRKLQGSLKTILNSSIFIFLILISSKFFSYLYRVLVARNFGPEEYGLLSLSLIIFTIFVTFSAFGLNEGLLRYIPFYNGKNKKLLTSYIISKTLRFILFSGLIFSILLYFSAPFIANSIFHNEQLVAYLRLFSFIVLPSILTIVFLAILQASEKVTWSSFINSFVYNGSKVLVFFLFLGLFSGIYTIMLSQIVGTIITFIFALLINLHYFKDTLFPKKKIKDNTGALKKLIMYSLPLLFSGILSSIFYWTDSFTIGYFFTVKEVGLYNAAVPIALLLTFTPEILLKLFFPFITKNFSKRNLNYVKELSKQIIKWIFIINLPLFFIVLLIPQQIINLLFGNEYILASDALRLLVASAIIASLQTVLIYLILMIEKSRIVLYSIIFWSLVNLILNFILVPFYSLTGAAFATLLVSLGMFLTYLYYVKKKLNFMPFRRKMFSVLISAIIPYILMIFILPLFSKNLINIMVLLITYMLLYLLILFISGSFDRNDMAILQSILKKFNLKSKP